MTSKSMHTSCGNFNCEVCPRATLTNGGSLVTDIRTQASAGNPLSAAIAQELTLNLTLRYKGAVKCRLLRIAVLLWIGWYISGPVAETFDFWDGPHQELQDIYFNAGGGVTVAACAFFLAYWVKNRHKSFPPPQRFVWARIVESAFRLFTFEHCRLVISNHSPPTPLRI